MKTYILQIELTLDEDEVIVNDYSHMHILSVKRMENFRHMRHTTLEGEIATVHVIDSFGSFSRRQVIALAKRWIDGDYKTYEYNGDGWKQGVKRS